MLFKITFLPYLQSYSCGRLNASFTSPVSQGRANSFPRLCPNLQNKIQTFCRRQLRNPARQSGRLGKSSTYPVIMFCLNRKYEVAGTTNIPTGDNKGGPCPR
ncbi:MAG: hypothetical protein JEZ07_12100 [Phycisphaerae bacterium]|nr:hypothetical protein [Phycisphaerae bacterium]